MALGEVVVFWIWVALADVVWMTFGHGGVGVGWFAGCVVGV